MQQKSGSLRRFLEYELAAAERYRRFVSLVAVASNEGIGKVRKVLGGTLRSSDLMEARDDTAIVLMGETDTEGALCAIRRYKDRCGNAHDLRFAVATYPTDEAKADGLFAVADRRLDRAMTSEFGAVVANG